MNENTSLFRLIHPSFIQPDGTVMSGAFNPSKNHHYQLSVYDGDQIDPKPAWEHFTQTQKLQATGVLAVTGADCESKNLAYRPDPQAFPEHVLIDLDCLAGSKESLTNKERKKKAMKLRDKATQRSWLFQTSSQA